MSCTTSKIFVSYQIVSTLENILVFSLLGSVGALTGALLLFSNKKLIPGITRYLIAFAAGVLIAVSFFDLLPEAVHGAASNAAGAEGINVFPWVVVGIVLFFFLERYIHSFHSHEKHHEHDRETKTTIPLIIIGDTVHNFVDGVVIAATFMTDATLGITATLAVVAHEVPQETGDLALLLHKGLAIRKVVVINVLSALAAVVGALITYFLGDFLSGYIPILLALTVGFFLYIALSDLFPEIQYEKKKSLATVQSFVFLAGVLTIWFATNFFKHG